MGRRRKKSTKAAPPPPFPSLLDQLKHPPIRQVRRRLFTVVAYALSVTVAAALTCAWAYTAENLWIGACGMLLAVEGLSHLVSIARARSRWTWLMQLANEAHGWAVYPYEGINWVGGSAPPLHRLHDWSSADVVCVILPATAPLERSVDLLRQLPGIKGVLILGREKQQALGTKLVEAMKLALPEVPIEVI